eukprot:770635-Alexandrium_andersonii.AAC.1
MRDILLSLRSTCSVGCTDSRARAARFVVPLQVLVLVGAETSVILHLPYVYARHFALVALALLPWMHRLPCAHCTGLSAARGEPTRPHSEPSLYPSRMNGLSALSTVQGLVYSTSLVHVVPKCVLDV